MNSMKTIFICSVAALCALGCSPSIDAPKQGLALVITGPTSESPFAEVDSTTGECLTCFIALVAEGPDINDDSFQVVKPYTPNAPIDLSLPAVPYGFGRQLRVELYSKDVNGFPSFPVRGRGRSVPKDVQAVETFLARAYVTKTNWFSSAISEAKQESLTDGRVGAAIVATADNGVMVAGGADAKPGASDPHSPNSWNNFKSNLLRYDVETRQLSDVSATFQTGLSTKRAFMASAMGYDGTVVFSGGYVDKDGTPEVTGLMEFFDVDTKQVRSSPSANAHLQFPRANHTITRLFDNANYFMIAGGKGPQAEASATWEIWEPNQGRLLAGQLSKPRWNHTTVRLPEKDGGYLMLIGGENASGPLNDFEVLQYDSFSNVSSKGNTKVTCCVGATCHKGPDSASVCASLKTQPGYIETQWQPLLRQLNGGVGRTMPAAAYVHRATRITSTGTEPGYNVVYVVGGFLDSAKTQVSDRIDVFDIETGTWIDSPSLIAARGAPLMNWATVGAQRGQVVIAGGFDNAGKTVASGEVLSYDPVSRKVSQESVGNTLTKSGFAYGSAVTLSTGKVLLMGGASSDGAGLKINQSIRLFNPK
ncbi:MAG TPA: hypothetical protein DCQ06_06185 [Myxococcales bacterium]|nr:hypothetical protein [Myxococcales bacterium]HAN31170.1 hypothetical protein [Myxococcales bacterium]